MSQHDDAFSIMNNQEQLTLQICTAASSSRILSKTESGLDPDGYTQIGGALCSGTELLQIRTATDEIEETRTSVDLSSLEMRTAKLYEFPRDNQKRDYGLWLLRDPLIRRANWSRLGVEPSTIPLQPPLPIERRYAALKRAFDVAASLILLILLIPLFVVIGILVRLDSRGAAFFRQRRVGKDGREFLLWKFRSMRSDVAKYAPSPSCSHDPRLTRIGRVIRRVSIDELPQLLNVLKGDMSLVGPRPEMPFIVDRYTPSERRRLAVKPGITGLWQISPARSYPIHENLHYDLHYINQQNLILDAVILFRTITAVIHGIGAV